MRLPVPSDVRCCTPDTARSCPERFRLPSRVHGSIQEKRNTFSPVWDTPCIFPASCKRKAGDPSGEKWVSSSLRPLPSITTPQLDSPPLLHSPTKHEPPRNISPRRGIPAPACPALTSPTRPPFAFTPSFCLHCYSIVLWSTNGCYQTTQQEIQECACRYPPPPPTPVDTFFVALYSLLLLAVAEERLPAKGRGSGRRT